MEDLTPFQKLDRVVLLLLLFSMIARGEAWAQTGSSPGPLKLYIEENSRLKQQKAALTTENEALKKALETEKAKSAQLQAGLDRVQPDILARERQLAEVKAGLNAANQKVARQELLSVLLAWIIVLLLLGLVAYSQRAAL